MGKHTDGGWLKEDDPIFTEGITGFTVRKAASGEEGAEVEEVEEKAEESCVLPTSRNHMSFNL